MASSRPAWLKPGQMIEAEFAQKMGVSRIALQRWRAKGLPHVKDGKYVIYDENAVMPWLRTKMLEDVMRTHSIFIGHFVRDFRECTEMGQNTADHISASLSKALSDLTLSEADRQSLEQTIAQARRDQVMRMQAASLYGLARDLQLSSPKYIATLSDTQNLDDLDIEITEENRTLAKTLVCHLFPNISPEYAAEMAQIMDEAYRGFQNEDESEDAKYEPLGGKRTTRQPKRTAMGG